MSTIMAMSWAFSLRGLEPLEKLAAIYFATHAGLVDEHEMGIERLDVRVMAEWCGCSKEQADIALSSLQRCGVEVAGVEDWIYQTALALPTSAEPPPRRSYEKKMYLYVVVTSNAVKIGIATNVKSRLHSYRTAIPYDFTVPFTAIGPASAVRRTEESAHRELSRARIRGEWFSCTASDAINIVRRLARAAGLEVTVDTQS